MSGCSSFGDEANLESGSNVERRELEARRFVLQLKWWHTYTKSRIKKACLKKR